MKAFTSLHNRTASRSEIEEVVAQAKEENNTEVIYRLSKILNAYPDEQHFVINIKDYPTTPTSLAGAHHTGDYREALDENGRLKKGWKFSNGQVVKVTPKKALDTPSTEENKENKLYKFIVVTGHNFLGIYSYNDPKIEGFWQTNTTDNGIHIFTAISKVKKITKKKGISLILQKYTEGKDFIFVEYDYASLNKYLLLLEKPILGLSAANDELTFLAAAGIDYFEQAPDYKAQGLGKPIPAADIYQMITDKVISMFKNAKASDYHRPWKDDAFFIPLNFASKKPYRGVNRLLLQERIGFAGAFRNPYFLTFNQIKKHGGKLKKGTRGYEVVYYSIRYIVPADKNTGRKAYSSTNTQKVIDYLAKNKLSEDIVTRIPMIRYYNVYNGASIEGIDFQLDKLQIGRAVPDTASENQAAALIVENYPNPPAIKHEGNQAYYSPSGDYVKMPKKEQFDSINDYYRTLFHELTHSTGHNKRLNRGIHLMLEKDDYAKEELVAEFGAVFLSAWAGIMWYTNKNHAAYLKNWNSAIKEAENDNKFLMRAASLAQQATDYILALDKDGNPAFLKKLQPKKAPKTPTDKSAPSDSSSNKNTPKIQIIPPYPIDIESNEENDDYMQLEKELINLMGDKFEVWENNLIEKKRKTRLSERSKEIKDNIATLKNKEIGTTAYEYVQDEYGYNYKVRKKGTKKYEVNLTIYRYGRFNPNEDYYNIFKTPEECSAFIIKTLDEKDGFYYRNWYGLSELQNKINELKGYQYSKQFHYEEEKQEEAPKKATTKAPSDSSTTITNTPTIATTLIASSTQPTRVRLSVANSKQEENYDKIADKNGFINDEKLKQLLEVWKKDKDFYFEEGFINPADFAKTAPASKEKGIFTLKNIVSKDKLRPTLTGVLIEKDKYIATDAMNLLIVKRPKNDGLKTGTIYDPTPEPQYSKSYRGTAPFADDKTIQNSRYIDRNYPKYESIVNIPNYKGQMFELAPIINTLYSVLDICKRIHTEDYRMVININGKESGYFISVKLLFNALQALKANGSEKAMFLISKEGIIYIISDNGNIALTVSAKGYDGSVRGHFIQLPTIELSVPKEFVPETKTTLNAPNGLFGKFPEIDTTRFKKMKVNELREFTLKYYNLYLKGEKENVEKHLKEVIFTTKAGRKIAYGEAMYSAKAAVIAHLKTLIKNSTYNNWGDRKAQDNPNILGYLNFKSKITIDGQKRHLRISVIVDKERNLELKSYDIGKKKSQAPKGTLPSAEGAQLSTNIPAKNVPNTSENQQIDKLAVPTVYVEHLPEETNQQISTSANTLDAKMAAFQTRNWESFVIANPELQRFLGDVEKKESESTAITIGGGAGSGKTRFAFQFINALAQNYKVGHASLEEHPDSKLYYEKVQQYIDETALPNIEAPEINNLEQLEALIQRNEVIVIDSFAKLRELDSRFMLDRDLRKKYNGKLFLIIYQLTGDSKMRGGSESEFDGDIILLTHVSADYRENYIYPKKNRYNAIPATQLRYSSYYQQMLDIPQELGTGSQPTEAISLPPAPQTNVYEVIY